MTFLAQPKLLMNLFAKPFLLESQSSEFTYFTPPDLANIYKFPTATGKSQTVGIIMLGGGYYLNDIKTYLAWLQIDSTNLNIIDVSIDGATNTPGLNDSYDTECALDVEYIASLCPDATIYVYFAPNSETGFYNAVYQAGIVDQRDCISISWGLIESGWTDPFAFNDLLELISQNGITSVFAASGDFGSSDGGVGNNVNFPGSSPFVVSCGGTTLTASVENYTIIQEVVWSDGEDATTGGGLSNLFTTPQYQIDNVLNYDLEGRRGSPDISANANANNVIYAQHLGGYLLVGGTSAVSPLLASLALRMNEILKIQGLPNVGFMQPIVYTATTTAFNDILVGSNGAFTAVQDYDLCSGLGSPIGTKMLNLYLTLPISLFTFTTSDFITFQFEDQSLGNPTSWSWVFGDDNGATSDLQNPTHLYQNQQAGKTTVSLSVTNQYGSSISSQEITFNPQSSWQIPVIIGVTVFFFLLLVVVVWISYYYKNHQA